MNQASDNMDLVVASPRREKVKKEKSTKSPRKSPKKATTGEKIVRSPIKKYDGKEGNKDFFEEAACEMYGFSATNCQKCGVHNSEIAGLLMQCGKCKKAYYCSMTCFNGDLEEHAKYCSTGKLNSQPKPQEWTPLQSGGPPGLSIRKIGDNKYQVIVDCEDPVQVTAFDGSEKYGTLKPGTVLSYTKCNQGRKNRKKQEKDTLALFGVGPLQIVATNLKNERRETESIDPSEGSPPCITMKIIDDNLKIHLLCIADDNGPVQLKVSDGNGHQFETIESGTLLCYLKQDESGPLERKVTNSKHGGFSLLSGTRDLEISATCQMGVSSTVTLAPSDPPQPTLWVESLGDAMHRVVAFDGLTGDPVTLEAKDSRGGNFVVEPGSEFSFIDAGKELSNQVEIPGTKNQKLYGKGDLNLTATSSLGATSQATVSPSAALPPKLDVNNLGGGILQLMASQDDGDSVPRIEARDRSGRAFDAVPGMIFTYHESKTSDDQGATMREHCIHGPIRRIRGQGDLVVIATAKNGLSTAVEVEPAATETPLEVEKLDDKTYKLLVSMADGPVTLSSTDKNGHEYVLGPQDIFRYIEAGKKVPKQSSGEDSEYGLVSVCHGHGSLTITATNQFGESSTVEVNPSSADAPLLEVQVVSAGVHAIKARGTNGGEQIELTFCDEGGQRFHTPLQPGDLIAYVEAGRSAAREELKSLARHGEIPVFRGHGDLTITATNPAGVQRSVAVRAYSPTAPVLEVKSLGNGIHQICVRDEYGELNVEGKDQGGSSCELSVGERIMYRENKDNLWSDKEDITVHGKCRDLLGKGDLRITATNVFGQTSSSTVHPLKNIEPLLTLKKVGHDLYQLEASDPNGGILRIEAKDSLGNDFDAELQNGDLLTYTENPDTNQSVGDNNIHNFRGPAPELWIYCYNDAGKAAKAHLDCKKKKAIKRQPSRVLTLEIADKLIFWYGRLGHPKRDDMKRQLASIVAGLPAPCGIVVEDVDLLPWIIRGTVLNTTKLHEIISELKVTSGVKENSETA